MSSISLGSVPRAVRVRCSPPRSSAILEATRWRAEFAAIDKALGGGSGWGLLTYSHRDKRLVNQWAADHTMTLAGSTPLLALDMYEHVYAMDYGPRRPPMSMPSWPR